MKMINLNINNITIEVNDYYDSMLDIEATVENSNDIKVTGTIYTYSEEPKNKDVLFSITENNVINFFTKNNDGIKLLINDNIEDENENTTNIPDIHIK